MYLGNSTLLPVKKQLKFTIENAPGDQTARSCWTARDEESSTIDGFDIAETEVGIGDDGIAVGLNVIYCLLCSGKLGVAS